MSWETALAKFGSKVASRLSLKAVTESAAKLSWKGLLKVGLGGGLLVGAASFIYSIPSAISGITGLSTQTSTILIALGVVVIVIFIARRR